MGTDNKKKDLKLSKIKYYSNPKIELRNTYQLTQNNLTRY